MSTGNPPPPVPFWQNPTFWTSIASFIVLIVGLIRGVPVAPSVQEKIDTTAQHSATAAEQSRTNGVRAERIEKNQHQVASKIGAPIAKE
jgi:hypothetical protein